ncbi:hypothetical protein LTR85_003843 [Meristemomyces frigidus]|nr:hypothetical protein LTR85_003843 [Meristemomyces frigidus]
MADDLAQIVTAIGKFSVALHSSYESFLTQTNYRNQQRHTEHENYEESSRHRGPRRLLYPTGTFAAAVWQPGDDVRLVCMSDDRKDLFWEIVAEALDLDASPAPEKDTLALPLHKLEPDIRHIVNGAKIYLHWCPVPEGYDRNPIPPYTSTLARRTEIERLHLAMARDAQILTAHSEGDGSLEIFDVFRKTYLLVRSWVENHGILGPRFGFLNVDTVLWLVANHCLHPAKISGRSREPEEYADDLFDRDLGINREGLVVHTATGYNMAKFTTREGLWAVGEALESRRDRTFERSKLRDLPDPRGYEVFLERYPCFVTVNFQCWDLSGHKRRRFTDETTPELVKQLATMFPYWYAARIWPNVITQAGGVWTYVLGITGWGPAGKVDERAVAEWAVSAAQSLTSVFPEAAITLEAYPRNEFRRLHPTPGMKSTTVSDDQQNVSESAPGRAPPPPASTRNAEITHPDIPKPCSKFRPASKALARVRHDPRHAGIDYEVGYQDRFDQEGDLKWLSLDNWGDKQTEDEDFIPEHRIRQLKRTFDGKIVWCRAGRIDLLGG